MNTLRDWVQVELLVGLLLMSVHTVRAQALDGNLWRRLPEAARLGYVGGVVDGLHLGGKRIKSGDGASCTDGWENSQLLAVVSKYVDAHPEQWHLAMSNLVVIALGEACKGSVR